MARMRVHTFKQAALFKSEKWPAPDTCIAVLLAASLNADNRC